MSDEPTIAAHLDVHGKPHLRPVADRLAAAAAGMGKTEPEENHEEA